MKEISFGRSLTDAELAEFSGGNCTVRVARDDRGNITGVRTEGDCSNVTIHVEVK